MAEKYVIVDKRVSRILEIVTAAYVPFKRLEPLAKTGIDCVKGVLEYYRRGKIKGDVAYYAIVGCASRHLIPLTEKDLREIMRLLGVRVEKIIIP